MTKLWQLIYLILISLLIISCTEEDNPESSNSGLSKDDSLDQAQQTLVVEVKVKEVEGFTVRASDFLIPVNTVGNVLAIKKGKIIAQVAGIFQFDFVFEGQTFQRGK